MCAGNECGNHFYCDAVPTRKGSLGGRNDASSVAWATHGASVAACIAGPAALLRRFSLAAWRGVASLALASPLPTRSRFRSWVRLAFTFPVLYCFLLRCCSSELHPGASQYFRAWSQYFLRLHPPHGDKPASILERNKLGASCRQCRLKPSAFTGGCVVLTEALS